MNWDYDSGNRKQQMNEKNRRDLLTGKGKKKIILLLPLLKSWPNVE